MSTYPNKAVKIVDYTYKTNLHLTRKIKAVQRRLGDDAAYIVAKDYQATIIVAEPGEPCKYKMTITVPKGMLTDLCSVPFWVRWIVSRVGPHLEASVVHDWLYVAWQVESNPPTNKMREFADDVFYAAMKIANVTSIKRWAIYRAVRLFGRSAFYSCDDPIFVNSDAASERQSERNTPTADISRENLQ